MTFTWLKELLKLNKSSKEIGFGVWDDMCKSTGMLDGQLKYTIIMLLDNMSTKYVNSQAKVNELENKIKCLESDVKTLKETSYATGRDLAIERTKNGVKIASKTTASVETIDTLRDRGLTYEQIAESLKVSRSTVWRHLKDKK
jgi:DNA-binding NarL/FixJ family response regulator